MSAAQVRSYDHGEGGRGIVVESRDINGDFGPLRVWLPGSAGFPAEVSFPDDFWRCDRTGLVEMRDTLDAAIRALDEVAGGGS